MEECHQNSPVIKGWKVASITPSAIKRVKMLGLGLPWPQWRREEGELRWTTRRKMSMVVDLRQRYSCQTRTYHTRPPLLS